MAKSSSDTGVQLPSDGANFSAYSMLGVQLGRTYVHSAVSEVMVETYRVLEQAAPQKIFVYGETGLAREDGYVRIRRTRRGCL